MPNPNLPPRKYWRRGTPPSRTASKRGTSYERKVEDQLRAEFGDKVAFQVRVASGIVDALIRDPATLVEIKTQYTYDAERQLKFYAAGLQGVYTKLIICQAVQPTDVAPHANIHFLRTFRAIRDLPPAAWAILPWSGKLEDT